MSAAFAGHSKFGINLDEMKRVLEQSAHLESVTVEAGERNGESAKVE